MLPSPIIEGVLPAFYAENGIGKITIPFVMSRAVNTSQISGFSLKIKNIQGSDYIATLDSVNMNLTEGYAVFEINNELLKEHFYLGSFYKAQLAYQDISNGEIGYYSTVGIIKYTAKPIVKIDKLKTLINNNHLYEYTGVYSQEDGDLTEKEYSYQFLIKDSNNNIIYDTGFLIHNSSKDDKPYQATDVFTFSQELKENEQYSICYTVKTNNGLKEPSPVYKIISKKSIDPQINATIDLKSNFDNGYIEVILVGEKNNEGIEKPAKGSFILSRASEKTDYMVWEELDHFILNQERPSSKFWKDFTIEQGVNYKYSIQQKSANLYSERIVSDIIYADFEDSFLYDGERQLKIKFNPKVTSFKKTLQEAKVDTIGSKYPFIFKNGRVEYKEFPISGLISYLMDDQQLFLNNSSHFPGDNLCRSSTESTEGYKRVFGLTKEKFDLCKGLEYYLFNGLKTINPETGTISKKPIYENQYNKSFKEDAAYYVKDNKIEKIRGTQLTSNNMQAEREFKLEVLDWLTNGKPKLFKSPAEGNYLVRLINSSLSPDDKLGRMLHTFSCTAYEIADVSYASLINNNIIRISDVSNQKYLRVMSIPLATVDSNFILLHQYLNYKTAETGDVQYFYGDVLKVGQTAEWVSIQDVLPGSIIYIDNAPIKIGATRSYEVQAPVSSIFVPETAKLSGTITIGYFGEMSDSFSLISSVENVDIIGYQFFGPTEDFISNFNDTIKSVEKIYELKAYKRPIYDCGTDWYIINEFEEYEVKDVLEFDNNRFSLFIQTESGFRRVEYEDDFDEEETYYKVFYHHLQMNSPRTTIDATQYSGCPYSMGMQFANIYKEVKFIDTGKQDKLVELSVYDPNGDIKIISTVVNKEETKEEDLQVLYNDWYNKKDSESQKDKIDAKESYDKLRSYILFPRKEEFRTVTNQYLYDYRDFNLMLNAGRLYDFNPTTLKFEVLTPETIKQDQRYFVLDLVHFIWDQAWEGVVGSDTIYITKETKKDYDIMYSYIKEVLIQKQEEVLYESTEEEKAFIFQALLTNYYKLIKLPQSEQRAWIQNFFDENDLNKDVHLWSKILLQIDPKEIDFNNIENYTIEEEFYIKIISSIYSIEGSFLSVLYPKNPPYESYIEIDGEHIDLTDSRYFEIKNSNINSLKLSCGVYCEVSYQEQNLEYDITDNYILQEKKALVDSYKEIFSKDYMLLKCSTTNGLYEYLVELRDAYANYNSAYIDYEYSLEQYLKLLELQGG